MPLGIRGDFSGEPAICKNLYLGKHIYRLAGSFSSLIDPSVIQALPGRPKLTSLLAPSRPRQHF